MKQYVLTILSFVLCSVAFSQDFHCGDTLVSFKKQGEYKDTRVHILVEREDRHASLWLHSIDYFSGWCMADKMNYPKIIVNAHCGGSGCAEKTYIIIDARTLMVELVPIQMKNNAEIAEKLLGKPIQ